ncbi:MAG TPA: hypothetical protein PL044_02550 [Clostridiales bacterium]|nr:MAG: hypothetical protein BWY37_00805 [Firmicutes bacterium ADurb.Bin262]HOU09095.1 hypothetical protein [Clostridiales bacterium]HQH62465.1 hypothetical protein [Clostridiales bacterium]HQK72644.1 hypothetical protein [Clostridiales bacterium]
MKKNRLFSCAACLAAMLVLLSGCGPFSLLAGRFRRGGTTTPPTSISSLTQEETTAAQTTQQTQTTAQGTQAPAVKDLYTLDDTKALDADFSAGFQVKIPMIVSGKPGAAAVNAEMEALKANILSERASAGDLSGYDRLNRVSYEYYADKGVLFLSVSTLTAYYQSEAVADNLYYAYDYGADRRLADTEVAALFGFDEAGVVAAVNAALAARGASPVTGFDKIDLFVNGSGVFCADAKVESMLGGEYPEIVELQ